MENMFNNVQESENEAIGKIEGQLPEWLDGVLIRSGPGKWDLDENFSLNHFLDGCAMMCKFEFDSKNKTVRAKSRYLQSNAYQKMCDIKRPVYTEFGTQAYPDTSKSFFARAFNKVVPSDLTDNDLSNVYKINDNEVFMTTESCNIWKIDPRSLDTLKKVGFFLLKSFQTLVNQMFSLIQINLDKKPGISISCSHPIYFEDEKVVYNVGSTFLTGMKYHIMKVPCDAPKAKNRK